MYRRLGAVLILMVLVGACTTKKRVQREDQSILEAICAIEEGRHGTEAYHADFSVFGNLQMDRYKIKKRDPEVLYAYFKQRSDLCRGALLQLMVEMHRDWFAARTDELVPQLDPQERIALCRLIRRSNWTELGPVVLAFLRDDNPTLRSAAASALEVLDQAALADHIAAVVKAETHPRVLEQLIFSIDPKQSPALAQILTDVARDGLPAARRTVLMVWSTSDLADKKALIGAYRADKDPQVAQTAQALLASLAEKDRLTFTASAPSVVHREDAAPADAATQEALVEALVHENLDAVDAALARGASWHQELPGGRTPFVQALWYLDGKGLQGVLDRGADVTLPVFDQPVLHYTAASVHDHVGEKLAVLVAAGCDVNAVLNDGQTAMMTACFNNRVEAVQALLTLGADPGQRDSLGRTPLDVARLLEYDDLIAVLEKVTP